MGGCLCSRLRFRIIGGITNAYDNKVMLVIVILVTSAVEAATIACERLDLQQHSRYLSLLK